MAELIEAFRNYREWPENFAHNTHTIVNSLDLKTYIRIVAIIGGYLFLRPYIVKLGARLSMKQHEKVLDPYEMQDKKKKAKLSPNALRGGKVEESSEEEEAGEVTGADWGKKARKRQRQVVRKKAADEERLRLEQEGEEDDKNIMDLLVDYEEGKDGW